MRVADLVCFSGGRAVRKAVQVRELLEQDADDATPGFREAVAGGEEVCQRGRRDVAEPAAAAAAARHTAAAGHAHDTVRLARPPTPPVLALCVCPACADMQSHGMAISTVPYNTPGSSPCIRYTISLILVLHVRRQGSVMRRVSTEGSVPRCRAAPSISPGCLPPFPGSNMALLTGDSPLPAGLPLSSPMLAPGGSTPDMVYFGATRPLVRPIALLNPRRGCPLTEYTIAPEHSWMSVMSPSMCNALPSPCSQHAHTRRTDEATAACHLRRLEHQPWRGAGSDAGAAQHAARSGR